MKTINEYKFLLTLGFILIFSSNYIFAQQKQHKHKNTHVFIDADGDGYNDNAPDHDGDGIPNGLDPDWTKMQSRKMNYIDADGDGINDLIQNTNQTDQQNQNGLQNRSGESIMDKNSGDQKGHQRGKGKK